MKEENKQLAVFEAVRKDWYDGEWYFSVVDIIKVLTDSSNPRNYWSMLKKREFKASGIQLSTICVQLKLTSASDGKSYATDCANTEAVLRIIQSVPSKKAEPFKQWLAEVGYDRIKESRNPSLIIERARKTYLKKGYTEEWIGQRIRSVLTRQHLTDEWCKRNIEGWQYGALSNEVYKGTFGMDSNKYKQIKNLPSKENLRDHMDGVELSLTSFAEAMATKCTRKNNSMGFKECKESVVEGTAVANKARIEAEKTLGEPVVSSNNYLNTPERLLSSEQRRLI